MTTEQANKRSSKTITFDEKLAILRELEAGSTRREVEESFRCSQSTISRVLSSRESILKMAESEITENGMRDAMMLNKDIDEPLTQWAHELKNSGEAITPNMVKQKADELARNIGQQFWYSAQWLQQWKSRENIKFAKRPQATQKFLTKNKEILKTLLNKGEQKSMDYVNIKRIKLENEPQNDMNLQGDKSLEAEGFRTESLNGSINIPDKPRIKREYIRRLPAFMKIEGGPEYAGTIYRSRKEKTFLTLLQKLEILQRLKNGERRPDLIIEYKLSQSAMSQIVSDEEKILKLAAGGQNLQMKRVRGGIFKDGEAELNTWVQEKMKIGENLTRTQIKNKAKEIADRLQIDFKASTGWLEKWKARMNLDFNESQILERKKPSYLSTKDGTKNKDTDPLLRTQRTKNESKDNSQLPSEEESIVKQEITDYEEDNNEDEDDYGYDDSYVNDVKPEFLTPQQFYMQTIQEDRQAQEEIQEQEDEEPEDIKPFIGTPPHLVPIPEYQDETLHVQVLNWLNKYNVNPVAATDLLNILQPHLNSIVKPTNTSTPLPKKHRYN